MKLTGIYVHIPFCKSKCAYCDFYSMPLTKLQIEDYVENLRQEIILTSKKRKDKTIDTIYIGGGTPSLLDIKELEKILFAIYANYNCQIKECSIEVNPCSSNQICNYKDLGINRISIGVQSLDQDILTILGRRHTYTEAIDAVERATKYFDNISADFILGVKKEYDIQKDLLKNPFYELLKNNLKHISAYILKVEENTPLYKKAQNGEYKILDEDEHAKQYEDAYKLFEKLGFLRYEISNFAKKGYESIHNLKYWQMRPYLGLGVNAHSYIDAKRSFNKSSLKRYMKGEHSGYDKQIAEESDKLLETIMLALRTKKGLDIEKFNKDFGFDLISKYGDKLNKIKKFISLSNGFLRIKDEYLLLQNGIIGEILY